MKIVDAKYYQPDDSDGDMGFGLVASIENTTESTVEFIQTSILLINSQNISVGGESDDQHDVFLDPGDSTELILSTGYGTNALLFGGDFNKISAIVDAQLYRKVSYTLGEIDVPSDANKTVFITKGADIDAMVHILGASIVRSKPSDDGDVSVTVIVGVRNISDTFFDKVVVEVALLDEEGSELENNEDYGYLPPRGTKLLTPGCYTNAGRLRNCKVRITFNLFQPVEYKTGNAIFVQG